jgi:long-chain acyl-CoA synthetase
LTGRPGTIRIEALPGKEGFMVTTLAQLFVNTVKTYRRDTFLLRKVDGVYRPISTDEFAEKVRRLALALNSLGFGKGEKLCLLSENRPEWTMTDLAVLCAGGLTVPIYTTLVTSQIQYIIDDSDAAIVVFSDAGQWNKIEPVRASLGKVRYFVTLEDTAPEGVLTFRELLAKGEAVEAKSPGLFDELVARVRPDDEASLIYTSGTTGVPKGVVLTHDNFLSNVKTVHEIIEFSDKDTMLSFLPLSHVLERMVTFTYLFVGATIAYAESIEALAQNFLEVRPHIMVSVPRVFEKIYTKVMDQVLASPSIRRKIFFWAIKTGKAWGAAKLAGRPIPGGLAFKRKIAAKLVFSKITAKTGGRVRFFVSGGAPLSRDIAEFFYAIGIVILEGYGLTETSPVLAVNTFEKIKFGTVGHPIPGVEIRIAPDGEILAKGPNIMKGYYKKEAETREILEGGWFHTGDIGHLDEEGFLVITDRKKDLIVTSGGKNIAPQPIENLLKTSPYISNVVVLGDRMRFVSALVVPDFDKLEAHAKANGIEFRDRAELVKDPRIVAFLKAEVDRSTPNLASYEQIKKIAVLNRDFEIERDEMTPTLKIRRKSVEVKYRELIESLYSDEPAGREG